MCCPGQDRKEWLEEMGLSLKGRTVCDQALSLRLLAFGGDFGSLSKCLHTSTNQSLSLFALGLYLYVKYFTSIQYIHMLGTLIHIGSTFLLVVLVAGKHAMSSHFRHSEAALNNIFLMQFAQLPVLTQR